ncbi:MAG: fibro-slime domain-containing protein, partial [Pseudobutyrivibrio sp.]|nr:fibro-slime domain-containing protein [Pseudobutyrivibrio sp.]
MRKYSILNRILSFSLALALLVASPVNVYAVDESSAAPVEAVDENIVEETVAEGEVSEPATDIVSEDSNSNSGNASSDESQNNSDASKSEDDSNTEEEVNKEESTDSTSEEVTDEDEASEEDAEEEVTEDEEEAEEEEEETEEEDVVLTFENDEVVITVTGSKEVLANIADITASKITEGENYQSIQAKLSEEAAKEEKELAAFVAYDISLIDENGAEVEPTGAVKVSITSITAPVSEESLSDAEVSLVHFEENADVTEMVDLTTENTTTINTGDDITTVDVEFEVESFSDFAVSWKTPSTSKLVGTLYWGSSWDRYANIYVVDEQGNAINSATFNWIQEHMHYGQSLVDIGVEAIDGDYFATLAKQVTVSGYTYKGAYFKNKNQVADLCYDNDYGWIYDDYPANNSWYYCYSSNKHREKINVYLVYSSDSNIGEQYFTANLYNYYMNTVNDASVATLSNQDGVLLFHNCGGDLSSDYSNGYYSGKKWNLCDTNGTSDNTPTAYQGIVGTSLLNNMPTFNYAMADIFNPTSSLFSGHNYDGTIYDTVAYKDVKIPFIKDSKGYYVFDTTSNEASGKFNDYKYDSNSNSLVRNEVDSKSGYWPFGSNDYHFGMDLQVYFNINEDGLNDDDSSATKFEFAGDDDVWVFIDGKLALDMGGVHQTVSGDIDFQNGACTVNYAYNESKGINRSTETHNLYTDVLGYNSIAEGRKALASGGHTLTVFYLERGAGASNCKIKFNFHDVNVNVPVDVSFDKVDETGEPLEGATFGLYASTDTDCSEEALYTAEST